MWRVLRILYVTLVLRCPACQRGAMFRSLFQMNVRCPVCNVVFERDHGEITGGMAINSVVVCALGVLGGVLAVVTDIPTGWLLAGITLTMILVGVGFYRHARALWVGIIFLTGSMFEDV